MLTALRYRNFRLLWIGLGISFAGSFMQKAAILWHVSLLVPADRKALALGLVGLVRVVPIVGFSLLSGVAAEESTALLRDFFTARRGRAFVDTPDAAT